MLYSDNRIEKTRRITEGLRISDPRAYRRLVEEFRDMSQGGPGAPFLVSHRWSTVRKYYYSTWEDEDFVKLLHDLGEGEA